MQWERIHYRRLVDTCASLERDDEVCISMRLMIVVEVGWDLTLVAEVA